MNKTIKEKEVAAKQHEHMIILPFLLFLGSFLAISIYQVLYWLRNDEWLSLPLALGLKFIGFGYPEVQWLGIQRIINWVMFLPLTLCLLLMCIISGRSIYKKLF